MAAFLNDFHGVAPENSTYVIWIGANDLDDALTAAQVTDESASYSIRAGRLATNIQTLWAAGARFRAESGLC